MSGMVRISPARTMPRTNAAIADRTRHAGDVESDQTSKSYILTKQAEGAIPAATVRDSDVSGPAAYQDPRLRQQLQIITGRRLSQFSMAVSGIRLAFWGEDAASIGREILIEHATLELARPGDEARTHEWNEDAVAAWLLAALDRKVTRIDVTHGYLSVHFENDLRLRVEPDRQYESWQISSDNQLLIVCTPGGELTIWYPDNNG